MTDGIPFSGEPVDSHEAIMRATFYALQKHGYAGLSIQRIADESDLSKSTFYHHFDGKDDILLSFLEFILDEFDRVFRLEATGDPAQDIRTFVMLILDKFPVAEDGPEQEEVLSTYVELRAQAIRNPEFRAKFTETDQRFTNQVATLIQDGIDQGVFEPVDPEQAAQFLLTAIDGVILQNATRDDDPVPQTRESINQYINSQLLADPTEKRGKQEQRGKQVQRDEQ